MLHLSLSALRDCNSIALKQACVQEIRHPSFDQVESWKPAIDVEDGRRAAVAVVADVEDRKHMQAAYLQLDSSKPNQLELADLV